jgi:cobalt/nickel transport protein
MRCFKKFLFAVVFFVLPNVACFAHFGMIIPSTNIVENPQEADLNLKIMFAHPFEGNTMNMEKPTDFGLYFEGKRKSLLSILNPIKVKFYADTQEHQAWQTTYKIRRPGDYIFYVEPKPYWEPAEDKFIIHYTKVIVNAFGKEESWDKGIGLKTEIIPLTRPYGIWTGNVFRGILKVNGKPVPFADIEVEYYNEKGKIKAPNDVFITQVIKTDANGVFTYTIPKTGWWGFAGLTTADFKLRHNDEEKEVELGAVIWINVQDMK